MKRLHVHVKVTDLKQAIDFYNTLFAMEPTVIRDDYAKWMVDDPRVNFAISTTADQTGVSHLGIQVEDRDELQEVYGRLDQAARPVLEVGRTTCCYADQDKSWISDPNDVPWETFLTHGVTTIYGEGSDLSILKPADETAKSSSGACCS